MIHGAYFGVATGELSVRDPATGEFIRVASDDYARMFVQPFRLSGPSYAARRLACISLRLIRHSAICTALSAAPLRRLSGYDPHLQAVFDRRILSNAADIGRVLADAFIGSDVAAVLTLVDDKAARALRKSRAPRRP